VLLDGLWPNMPDVCFRSRSVARLAEVGINVPSSLPLLDDLSLRPAEEILDRLICLHAVAAVARGFDREKAYAWISQEGTLENLTQDERKLILTGAGDLDVFKVQVEGMWALSWVLSIVPRLDFWSGCDSRFVTMLPDLKKGESSSNFRARAQLRSEIEVGIQCDLAYCLHWALREAELKGSQPPRGLTPYIVTERRRALEWAIGTDAWDMISLDT
jgi:hypothetical protein